MADRPEHDSPDERPVRQDACVSEPSGAVDGGGAGRSRHRYSHPSMMAVEAVRMLADRSVPRQSVYAAKSHLQDAPNLRYLHNH